MKSSTERRFLPPTAVCERLAISRRAYFQMVERGDFGPQIVHLGPRQPRVDSCELDAWIGACAAAGRLLRRREWLERHEVAMEVRP